MPDDASLYSWNNVFDEVDKCRSRDSGQSDTHSSLAGDSGYHSISTGSRATSFASIPSEVNGFKQLTELALELAISRITLAGLEREQQLVDQCLQREQREFADKLPPHAPEASSVSQLPAPPLAPNPGGLHSPLSACRTSRAWLHPFHVHPRASQASATLITTATLTCLPACLSRWSTLCREGSRWCPEGAFSARACHGGGSARSARLVALFISFDHPDPRQPCPPRGPSGHRHATHPPAGLWQPDTQPAADEPQPAAKLRLPTGRDLRAAHEDIAKARPRDRGCRLRHARRVLSGGGGAPPRRHRHRAQGQQQPSTGAADVCGRPRWRPSDTLLALLFAHGAGGRLGDLRSANGCRCSVMAALHDVPAGGPLRAKPLPALPLSFFRARPGSVVSVWLMATGAGPRGRFVFSDRAASPAMRRPPCHCLCSRLPR